MNYLDCFFNESRFENLGFEKENYKSFGQKVKNCKNDKFIKSGKTIFKRNSRLSNGKTRIQS